MNKYYAIILLMFTSFSCFAMCLKPTAKEGAIADTATTAIALNMPNVSEMNPLGFIGTTLTKIFLLDYRESLPKESQVKMDNFMGPVWMGATINNVLVIAGATTPVSIVVGIISGITFYNMPPCEEK